MEPAAYQLYHHRQQQQMPTPLNWSFFLCTVPQVEFLLQRGVDPDVRARGGDETALMVAAKRGQRLHLRVAAALIKAGANKLARDVRATTYLASSPRLVHVQDDGSK